MGKNVIRIIEKITVNVDVSVIKKFMFVKEIMFGILQHVTAKMKENI